MMAIASVVSEVLETCMTCHTLPIGKDFANAKRMFCSSPRGEGMG